ncbi:glutamate racemase [Salisediminibacterium beveridgei]|uniref:Glutamate racemase n=1 Tax=Salisediminibacterium beveridgei TaxID=632773 RepID=A0A1D7QTG7_9BACI|nr:glutamate racemase [Salisediminibacterium beveridgei]AOM82322.1 Glutamate racemase [Salisediminibacterium beveridgei]
MERPIGVIDSGVGGLTVVSELMRQLPKEEIIYIGDTLRCPYGPRPASEVADYSWEMIEYLMSFDIKILVIACNTASAVILEEARQRLPIPVIGVIHPGAIAALKVTENLEVGVIGTEGTISSGSYYDELKSINDDVKVVSLACPTLVPLVESSHFTEEEALDVISEALKPLLDYPVDSLILGCTHYPMIEKEIQQVVGDGIHVICSGDETAREVSSLLYHKKLLFSGERRPDHVFYTTGAKAMFKNIAESWLKRADLDIRKTDLQLPVKTGSSTNQ